MRLKIPPILVFGALGFVAFLVAKQISFHYRAQGLLSGGNPDKQTGPAPRGDSPPRTLAIPF